MIISPYLKPDRPELVFVPCLSISLLFFPLFSLLLFRSSSCMMGGSGGITLNRLLSLLAVGVSLPYTVWASPAWNTGT